MKNRKHDLKRIANESYPDRVDTRRQTRNLVERLEFSSWQTLSKITICLSIALAISFVPEYEGLSAAGHKALFILILAAGLWITEAIPAFSVAILVIALEIAILGDLDNQPDGWKVYVETWSSPLIWLFFGGLVMASAAHRTKLDKWFAFHILTRLGNRPAMVLAGIMLVTFIFSMFMSNTATAAMMLTVIAPLFMALGRGNPFGKAMLLAVPFAANIGGMGTIIGSPPNAIAAGALANSAGQAISFVEWMIVGVPVAVVLLVVLYIFLLLRYPSAEKRMDFSQLESDTDDSTEVEPVWKKLLVMVTFITTILLWMTQNLHGIPTAVVSFLPITVFATTGIFRTKEMRSLSWDVLMLMAGGLSLGIAMQKTGLAQWLVTIFPFETLGTLPTLLLIAFIVLIISNFISNTSAASIVIPIGLSLGIPLGLGANFATAIALSASAAMCLPISTPPNAIAFSMDRLETSDFIVGGLIVGVLGPPLAVFWTGIVF
jgi:solute carrier family 13 (sodium-dependent dicarboxylate transporter), member 2/3/5